MIWVKEFKKLNERTKPSGQNSQERKLQFLVQLFISDIYDTKRTNNDQHSRETDGPGDLGILEKIYVKNKLKLRRQ